jgi:GTPase SAR1 family protein
VDEDGRKIPVGELTRSLLRELTCWMLICCLSIALVDIWDTAGQERFNSMHSSYYYRANACIMVFDVTRKVRWAQWLIVKTVTRGICAVKVS